MAKDEQDVRNIRCRMLGHEVPFSYCRTCGQNNIPCRKIFDCWYETFDVDTFMREHYSPEQLQAILSPPTTKVASLVDLIDKARQSMQPKTTDNPESQDQ